MNLSRNEVVARLRVERDAGRAVYDALCGSGITAKFAARGGADLITTFNLAYYRMQGLSSMAGYLPIGDANAITLELGERSILNAVRECPVVAGLLGTDPTRNMFAFVDRIRDAGFHGVMNCPTIALIDGNFRKDLEETGMGFSKEVDVLGYASSKGMFTKAFTTAPDEALAMAEAGVDNIIIHFGNSSGGSIGSKTVMPLDEAAQRAAEIFDALFPKYEERIFTCHGGAIETASDFEKLLDLESRFDGYVGGSSAERFPVEDAVPKAALSFKSVRLRK
ncbi:MAG: phosphoenolpyruvate hydrolase family protein [Nitrospinae bacterium]|nr:phosphoenolpyruvate hydrolase family protein [Nitrospinota bacterium]